MKRTFAFVTVVALGMCVAAAIIIPPPVLFIQQAGSDTKVTIQGTAGYSYVLEATDNLGNGTNISWTPLHTNTFGAIIVTYTFTDTNALMQLSQRSYRAYIPAGE